MSHPTRSALVTGATSGLGYAAAAQLAQAGFAPVRVTGRTAERAADAASRLAAQTGLDVFEAYTVDLGKPASVEALARAIAEQSGPIDALILNAGSGGHPNLEMAEDGIELTFAGSLTGHHRLTMRLLEYGTLAGDARVVIAGSEAARGDVPTFSPTDIQHFAGTHFGGDLTAAAESLMRYDGPHTYKPSNAYANAKLFVALWAGALARRLPDGMTVNAVSPGSAPGTDFARKATFFMRRVMVPVLKAMPARFGLAASVETAASRYVDAIGFPADVSGQFFASAPKKMTGPLHRMDHPHFHDERTQEAVWDATVRVTGGVTVTS